jgi:tetratricopeptide (TPR) repeat protein
MNMKRTFNARLFLLLLLATAGLVVGVHLLHDAQLRSHAGALLDNAAALEDQSNLNRASVYLKRYLEINDTSAPAQTRYALVLARAAQTNLQRGAAYFQMQKALQRDPNNYELRRRFVLLIMHPGVGRYNEAIKELARSTQTRKDLRQTWDSDPEIQRLYPRDKAVLQTLYAQALDAHRDYVSKPDPAGKPDDPPQPGAVGEYEKAIALAPDVLENYARRAAILREQMETPDPKQADAVIDRMVAANAKNYRAYRLRAEYRQKYSAGDAVADARVAVRLAPPDAEDLLPALSIALERPGGDAFKEACEFLRVALGKRANRTDLPDNQSGGEPGLQQKMYLLLAQAERMSGPSDAAATTLREGLKVLPEDEHAPLLWALADTLMAAGDYPKVCDPERIKEKRKARGVNSSKPVDRAATVDLVEQLHRAGEVEPRLRYLEARVLAGCGEWLAAAQDLEAIYPELHDWPELQLASNLLLGESYGQLSDFDLRHERYVRAVVAAPGDVGACLGMAVSLEAAGQLEEAQHYYRRIVDRKPRALLNIARLEIARCLQVARRQPAPAGPRWDKVEKVLAEAEKAAVPAQEKEKFTIDVSLVRAESLAAQRRYAEADRMLRAARDKDPRNGEAWLALAALAEQQGKPDRALAILDEAQQVLGERDQVSLRLARAGLWGRRGGPGAAAALAQLEQEREKLPSEYQDRLLAGIAQALVQVGDTRGGAARWQELARRQPHNLQARLALFDLALEQGQEETLKTVVEELRSIEGEEGTLWRYGLARIGINRAWKGEPQNLEDLRQLLEAVRKRRPSWPRVHVALGELYELQHRKAAALEKYRHAVLALGERNPAVLRRLLELLSGQGYWKDATDILRQLPPEGLPGMERLIANLWQQSGDVTRALRLARTVVAADSKDYRDHIWLGQLLWAAGRRAEGEKHLLDAVALAETVPDPWVALVQVLALSGRQEAARERIAQARRKLPAGKSDLALAQCYEAVSGLKEARQLYQSALKANPDNPAVLRGFADFCLRQGPVDDAKRLLETLHTKGGDSEDAAWASRMHALLLAVHGDEAQTRDAFRLLDLRADSPLRPSAEDSVADLRTKAMVLAGTGNLDCCLAAIAFLEEVERRSPSAFDLFLLARQYEAANDWRQAGRRLRKILSEYAGDPLYDEVMAHYALQLLYRGNAREAADYLAQLEKRQPDKLEPLELRCRWLVLNKEADKVVGLVQQWLAKYKDADLRRLADLLEALGQYPEAEKLLRRWVAQAKEPDASLLLAKFLGRRGRLHEAIDLCDKARATVPMPAVAGAALSALYDGPPDAAERARVAGWLQEAISKAERKAQLRTALALLRDLEGKDLEGKYDEAIELYRQVLAEDERHLVALNNLAWLLAIRQGKANEALELLEAAKALKLSPPELPDTRAVVFLCKKDAKSAIKELEKVTAIRPTATAWFHLAWAHQMDRDNAAALVALDKANKLGLSPAGLHPLEQRVLAWLRDELVH